MASDSVRRAIAALVLLTAIRPAEAQLIVTGLHYESPTLVAPTVLVLMRRGGSTTRVSQVGWTMGANWSRTRSPRTTSDVDVQLTPINANSSNKIYPDGLEVDSTLRYANSALQVSVGGRLNTSPRWASGVRVVAMYQRVSDLDDRTEAFWRRPFAGIELLQRYERLTSNDPLRSQWTGVRAQVVARGLAGHAAWGTLASSVGVGQRYRALLGRATVFSYLGSNLNVVNRFLLGSSWEASDAVYGYHYAAFRVDHATVVNGALDARVIGPVQLGIRRSQLYSGRMERGGSAVVASSIWNGIAGNVGVAWPDGRHGAHHRVVVAELSSAILR